MALLQTSKVLCEKYGLMPAEISRAEYYYPSKDSATVRLCSRIGGSRIYVRLDRYAFIEENVDA